MLLNRDFAFIHFPKTAGKSLTRYFIEAWETPIEGWVSPGQVKEVANVVRPGITLNVGFSHASVRRAGRMLASRGQRIEDLRAIFTCIRNPYDLAVSTYYFMRNEYLAKSVEGEERTHFRAAAELDFEGFWASDVDLAPPEFWMAIDGRVLPNQRFIRFESMVEDLRKFASELGFRHVQLPHLNRGQRGDYRNYMTPRAERAIYERFEFLFRPGFYDRESFG